MNGPDAANDETVAIIRPRVLESAADASFVPLHEGGIFTARVQDMAEWARANSMWPALFGLACCAIEMMSMSASRWDIARFGAEAFRASPRQSDLMIVAGRLSTKMAPVLRQI